MFLEEFFVLIGLPSLLYFTTECSKKVFSSIYTTLYLLQVEIQAKLDDKHVVKIFDTVQVPSAKQLFIVMEYCEGGNLMQWVERNRKHQLLNETVILQMLYEICEAVYSCHQKKIIHRDLKPENILLDSKRRIKLGEPEVTHTSEQ